MKFECPVVLRTSHFLLLVSRFMLTTKLPDSNDGSSVVEDAQVCGWIVSRNRCQKFQVG